MKEPEKRERESERKERSEDQPCIVPGIFRETFRSDPLVRFSNALPSPRAEEQSGPFAPDLDEPARDTGLTLAHRLRRTKLRLPPSSAREPDDGDGESQARTRARDALAPILPVQKSEPNILSSLNRNSVPRIARLGFVSNFLNGRKLTNGLWRTTQFLLTPRFFERRSVAPSY